MPAATDHTEVKPRGATQHPRSGAVTESASLHRHRSGQEELPNVRGQERQPRGATLHPRSGSCAGKGSLEELLPFKARRGGHEEIPLVQGKEQWLCFAVAAVKRYPRQSKRNSSKTVGVARGHQRADTLKPKSQKTSHSDHMDHSLV